VTLRWADYVAVRDSVDSNIAEVWRAAHRKGEPTAYVLGEGFDPRALVGLRRLVEECPDGVEVYALQLAADNTDESTVALAEANRRELEHLCATVGLKLTRVALPETHEPSSAGRTLAQHLVSDGALATIGHVIVDISALPSGIHFPLLGALLRLGEAQRPDMDVQVVVCENAELDEAIIEQGNLGAGPIGGFKYGLDWRVRGAEIRVWAPVLGKGQRSALQALYERLKPDEICPVLPFPAGNPRRPDELVVELHELLIESWEVEARNFIYADERNPFDLYRTLSRLDERYTSVLEPLGPAKVVLSSHASKTLALGVFLTAHDKKLSVVSAGPAGYSLAPGIDLATILAHNELACFWLHGAPYQ
jgi:hypothetical protein